MASTSSSSSGEEETSNGRYLIVWPRRGPLIDVLRFLIWNDGPLITSFIESSDNMSGLNGGDHRWIIVISIIIRRILSFIGKPLERMGFFIEFFLNLLSENGNILGLVYNIVRGRVVFPQRDSETFISTIGHLDGRIDLYKGDFTEKTGVSSDSGIEIGTRVLMDLCMMASKLAYENAKVVRNIVVHHWKMHFVDFYNGWNDFQKERSTQVFILCDKPKDASLILISFRGTEPFDADDWSTDFDYSWYEIPRLGKVHMGFLEALGLGNRTNVVTFQEYLQIGVHSSKHMHSDSPDSAENSCDGAEHPSSGATTSNSHSYLKHEKCIPQEITAYYAVRSKLRSLLKEHKNAKFVVTGHSLGGALAILFPTVLLLHKEEEIMQRLLGVYTFGQPRIGDRQLVRYMEAHVNYPVPRYFRVVYCNDLVPRLPYDDKTFLYKHFGVCLYYNSFYIEQVSIMHLCWRCLI
eukprot:TRINITY_DN8756_c0_g1_i2.p1 TRINITY_DN8756_c0_g1~~TRINITY_DN8756_c0_g1_i2.p1  ORF type:complete len:464 (-),score=47.99 TRINITY_DN8756_c0_g1_i2:1243-2634(-)